MRSSAKFMSWLAGCFIVVLTVSGNGNLPALATDSAEWGDGDTDTELFDDEYAEGDDFDDNADDSGVIVLEAPETGSDGFESSEASEATDGGGTESSLETSGVEGEDTLPGDDALLSDLMTNGAEPADSPVDDGDDFVSAGTQERAEKLIAPEMSTRIVGGSDATPIFEAALIFTFATDNFQGQFCGGTIINVRWILTAAHCVDGGFSLDPTDLVVQVGDATLSQTGPVRGIGVRQIVVHPGWNRSAWERGNWENDIALLELEAPVPLGPQAQIAALPTGLTPAGTPTRVSGWGALQFNVNSFPLTLQSAQVEVVSDSDCQALYGNSINADLMLCAGVPLDYFQADSCQGDSGGPLAVNTGSGWEVIGVTSFGIGCASGYPGVYAEVRAFTSWIQQTVAGSFPLTTPPSLSGEAVLGELLDLKPGSWSTNPAPAFDYSWFRCSNPVPRAPVSLPAGCERVFGFTGLSFYLLQDEDVGSYILGGVAATSAGTRAFAYTAASSQVVEVGVFRSTPRPKITGLAAEGQRLRVSVGKWDPKPSWVEYQWLRNGREIPGAFGRSYRLTRDDLGKRISVRVTAQKFRFEAKSRTSVRTDRVGKRFSTRSARITGTAEFGTTLRANPGTWGTSKVKFKYQWLRDGKPIKKATKATYKLRGADVGKRIQVQITGSKKGFATETRASSQTREVRALRFNKVSKPKPTGTVQIGKSLRVKPGDWGTTKIRYSYQWLRNGKPISGATKARYKLKRADAGKRISVRITGTKSGYRTQRVTSTVRNEWRTVTRTTTVRADQIFPVDKCRSVGTSENSCRAGGKRAGRGGVRLASPGGDQLMAIAGSVKLDGAPQRYRLTFNRVTKKRGSAFTISTTTSQPQRQSRWREMGTVGTKRLNKGTYRTKWSTRTDGNRIRFVVSSTDRDSLYLRSVTIQYRTIL